jgi:DNA-binding response OmpR family regulator
VLDVMLPDGSGRSFCEQLRRRGNRTPVLMLTAKNTPPDIIAGLEAGADDYLGKPFDLSELLGRIAALLRRRQWDRGTPSTSRTAVIPFGAATLDRASRRIRTGDAETELTELELRLAEYFVQRPHTIVRRESLLEDVWGVSPNSQTRTVDNFVVRLRKLIEPDPRRPRYLTTIRGAGYRYAPGD